MNYIKSQRSGSIMYLVVFLFSIITLSVYVLNVNKVYYQDMKTSIIYMMLGALLTILISNIIPQTNQSPVYRIISDIARILTPILIVWAGVTFISMRVESFGYIFGSNLEMGNEAAFDAGQQAIVGIVLFIVTWILSIIASFLKIGKK
ncbi:hypothetical protein ACTQ5J_09460 [Fundicoccus sp. Sow4_F4]|uniref:hypothetical protein n=1 Tax=Fundicoccus sp. Sow4_F4 TaxID=3438783 RepID=UPI003F8FFA5E